MKRALLNHRLPRVASSAPRTAASRSPADRSSSRTTISPPLLKAPGDITKLREPDRQPDPAHVRRILQCADVDLQPYFFDNLDYFVRYSSTDSSNSLMNFMQREPLSSVTEHNDPREGELHRHLRPRCHHCQRLDERHRPHRLCSPHAVPGGVPPCRSILTQPRFLSYRGTPTSPDMAPLYIDAYGLKRASAPPPWLYRARYWLYRNTTVDRRRRKLRDGRRTFRDRNGRRACPTTKIRRCAGDQPVPASAADQQLRVFAVSHGAGVYPGGDVLIINRVLAN